MTKRIARQNDKQLVLLVHFGDEQFRGSERCLLNLINGIDTERYDIVLWSNHKGLSDAVANLVTEVVLGDFPSPFSYSPTDSRIRRLSTLMDLVRQAKTLIRRTRPSVIVCNSLAPCQWMFLSSIFSGIPLLVYLHSTYLPRPRLLSLAFGASHLIAVSKFTVENFLADGFPEKNISVVYSGVDDLSSAKHATKSHLREELGIGADEFVLTSLSALIELKKVDVIIDAFKSASSSPGQKMALLIVGDGPCLEELKARAAGFRIFFCGWRDNPSNILSASDCFVSATEREALGLSLLEAASMELPLIGARAGGVVEVINDEETGLLADKGDPHSFARCMIRLRDNPEFRRKLGRNARHSFEQRFQVQRMQREINSVIGRFAHQERHPIRNLIQRVFRLARLSARLLISRFLLSRSANQAFHSQKGLIK